MSRKKRVVRSRTEEKKSYAWIWGIVGGLGVIALLILVFLSLRPEQVDQIEGLQVFRNLPREHDDTVVYDGPLPPAGGVHAPIWQNCGIYDTPILGKNAVHSLEHGAVWVTYHPDLPSDQVDRLKNIVRGQSFILLSPWPEQSSPIVLSAWGLQLLVDSVDDDRVEQFIDEYRLGPQTPEPGATCAGGLGDPSG